MKRLTVQQKKENLNSFLKTLDLNEKYFIYSVNKGKDAMFCVAYILDKGVHPCSDFMDYENMDSYLKGVQAAKFTKILIL